MWESENEKKEAESKEKWLQIFYQETGQYIRQFNTVRTAIVAFLIPSGVMAVWEGQSKDNDWWAWTGIGILLIAPIISIYFSFLIRERSELQKSIKIWSDSDDRTIKSIKDLLGFKAPYRDVIKGVLSDFTNWASIFLFLAILFTFTLFRLYHQNNEVKQADAHFTISVSPIRLTAIEGENSYPRQSAKSTVSNGDLDRVIAFLDSRLPTEQEWHNLIDVTKKPSEGETPSSIIWLWILVAILIAGLVAILIWPKKNPENEFPKWVKVLLVLLPLIPVVSPSLKDFATAWRIMWPLPAEKTAKPKEDPPPPTQPPSESLLVFPFFFDLGGNMQGEILNGKQDLDLRKILSSVKACAGQQSNNAVELLVQGFADANQFPTNNREKNLALANRRAKELHSHVAEFLQTENLRVRIILKLKEWEKYEDMTKSPRYLTAKSLRETENTSDQGYFNRRAEILLLKVGDCSPSFSSSESS